MVMMRKVIQRTPSAKGTENHPLSPGRFMPHSPAQRHFLSNLILFLAPLLFHSLHFGLMLHRTKLRARPPVRRLFIRAIREIRGFTRELGRSHIRTRLY